VLNVKDFSEKRCQLYVRLFHRKKFLELFPFSARLVVSFKDAVINLLLAAGLVTPCMIKTGPRPSILTQEAQQFKPPSVYDASGRGEFFRLVFPG
jgi:hypothetical protein